MKSIKIAVAALSALIAFGAYAADTDAAMAAPATTHKTAKKTHKPMAHKKAPKHEAAPAAAPAAN